jgi:methylmalonyl-CoA/ethylmalonyl-CoA epimerase
MSRTAAREQARDATGVGRALTGIPATDTMRRSSVMQYTSVEPQQGGAPGMPEPLFTDTMQIALVVRDLDATLRTWVHEYGIGPWQIFEFQRGSIDNLVHDDEPAEFTMRIAVGRIGKVEWEIIQPLDDVGPYAEYLATKGEGFHHVQFAVRDYDDAMRVLREKGHKVHIGGEVMGTRLAYMSTDTDLGLITEYVDFEGEAPVTPVAVYPPADE